MTDNERLAVLETKVEHLTEQLDAANRKLDDMVALFNQAKGARWVLIGSAAIGGAVAALATKLIPVIGSMPR